MALIHFVTLNNFTLTPVSRFIIDTVSNRYNSIVTETYIHEQYLFNRVSVHNKIATYRHGISLGHLPLLHKLGRHLLLLYFLLRRSKNEIVYTPDYQVVFWVMLMNKMLPWYSKKIVYHQFEMIDTGELSFISAWMWRMVKKHGVAYIAMAVFPEKNRLRIFTKQTGVSRERCYLFPNTTDVGTPSVTKSPLFPPEAVVVGHIGSVGNDHYISVLEELLACHKSNEYLYFLVIGNYCDEIKQRFLDAGNPRLILKGLVPHSELPDYYIQMDYGLILYKGVSMNFEFCAPNKLYEYLSYGVRVIAHPLAGLKELELPKHVLSLIDFESDNREEIAAQFLSGKNHNKKEILAYFSENLSIDHFMEGLMQQIDRIIS